MRFSWQASLVAALLTCGALLQAAEPQPVAAPKVEPLTPGQQAPEFVIKDADGKQINLAELTAHGPVLVRLTCGCSGCDKELAYFQALHEAYKDKGLTSLAVFKEPDKKVEAYVKEKKLKMLYAIDSDGKSWTTFHTSAMPSNFLIEKGGKIKHIATGCDPSGLIAKKLSDKVADLVDSKSVDVQATVNAAAKAPEKK